MGQMRFGRAPRRDAAATVPDWCVELARNARAHGASPYVVEGFTDISDAVRRGHAVLVRREHAEVAAGVTVFEHDSTSITGALAATASAHEPIVAILRFDPSTARYVLHDANGATGSVQLTPRRLATYLAEPSRATGVALGA